jgi:hypothetical protein
MESGNGLASEFRNLICVYIPVIHIPDLIIFTFYC